MTPDPLPTDLSPGAQKILDACEASFAAHKADCSGFVKAVGAALGVTLTGRADDIVAQIQTAEWTRLADGKAAKTRADEGMLVVAGLKGGDQAKPEAHGHVVVVVAGKIDPTHASFPHGYWGRLNAIGERNITLNFAWKKADLANVTYACRAIEA